MQTLKIACFLWIQDLAFAAPKFSGMEFHGTFVAFFLPLTQQVGESILQVGIERRHFMVFRDRDCDRIAPFETREPEIRSH